MLLSVCLNPAVDVTYQLGTPLVPGESHRVGPVHQRAGGKGINVARVLAQLGVPAIVLAPVGGDTGETIRTELEQAGLASRLVEVAGPSRRTLAVVDPLDATLFNEPGPEITPAEWSALLDAYRALLGQVTLVVLSGSLPPGIPIDGYRVLCELARSAGVRAMVDAEGRALALALAAEPYLVKPNRAELATIIGGPLERTDEIVAAARQVRAAGARNVVVSNGSAGLIAVTENGSWQAVSGEVVAGNPTGAGDALVAALAAGAQREQGWPQRLRDGVANSAAAVASPVAGAIDLGLATRLEPGVVVTALDQPH